MNHENKKYSYVTNSMYVYCFCASSKHYRGCDGKKKFKHKWDIETDFIVCCSKIIKHICYLS